MGFPKFPFFLVPDMFEMTQKRKRKRRIKQTTVGWSNCCDMYSCLLGVWHRICFLWECCDLNLGILSGFHGIKMFDWAALFVTEQKGDCSFLIFLLKVNSTIVAQMHCLSRLHGVTYRLILVRSRQVQVPFCRVCIMLVFLFTYAYIHIYMYIHIMLYQCISYGT